MQRNIIKATKSFSKRDAINSVNGLALQEHADSDIVVTSAALIETIDDNGETKSVSVLVGENQDYYTSISSAVYNSTDILIELIDEEGQVTVTIEKRESKGGRPYLVMMIH